MIEDAEIAAAFGVEEADVTDAMRNLVERSLVWIERRTGNRYFHEPKEFVEYHEGGGRTLWLKEVPIVEQGESDDLGVTVEIAGEVLDKDEYDLVLPDTPDAWTKLVHVSCWPKPPCSDCRAAKNIRVTYDAGYEVGGLPEDIEQMALDLAVGRYRAGTRESEGLKKEAVDGYSYEAFGDGNGGVSGLTAEHRDTLSDWRHPVLG